MGVYFYFFDDEGKSIPLSRIYNAAVAWYRDMKGLPPTNPDAEEWESVDMGVINTLDNCAIAARSGHETTEAYVARWIAADPPKLQAITWFPGMMAHLAATVKLRGMGAYVAR